MFVILLTLRLPNPGGVARKPEPRGPLRTLKCGRYRVFSSRRVGRAVECGGLENR
jgi:hypothetical protein